MATLTIAEEIGTQPAPVPEGPVRRPRWWIEAILIVWLAWLYDVINDFSPLRPVAPYNHALSVLRLERWLHLDPELTLNRWTVAHWWTGWLAANYYDTAHYIVTFSLVIIVWWRRPEIYRPLRNSLALVNLFGFVVFWTYPMAPPRLTPGQPFVDIVDYTHAFGSSHTGRLAHAANELAAMPSLHISWAIWSALAFCRLVPSRWARLAWAYPALTTVVVLTTGNHFVLDVMAGALTLVVAVVIVERGFPLARVHLWPRMRRLGRIWLAPRVPRAWRLASLLWTVHIAARYPAPLVPVRSPERVPEHASRRPMP